MKRYSPSRPGSSQMNEDPEGQWVRWEDVDRANQYRAGFLRHTAMEEDALREYRSTLIDIAALVDKLPGDLKTWSDLVPLVKRKLEAAK